MNNFKYPREEKLKKIMKSLYFLKKVNGEPVGIWGSSFLKTNPIFRFRAQNSAFLYPKDTLKEQYIEIV